MSKKITLLCSRLLIILALFSFIYGCGIDISKNESSADATETYIPSKLEKNKLENILFLTECPPETLTSDTKIALDILDDITGYSHNIHRYQMNHVSGNKFEVSVPLSEHFDFRYRYVLTSPIEAFETTASGETILFRMAVAKKGLTVNDVISSWTHTSYLGKTAQLNGLVEDQKTGEPLADILINIAGYQTITDTTGRFSISNIPVGVHNLVAYSLDGSYALFQQQANLVSGLSTPAIISMQPLPEVEVKFVVGVPDNTEDYVIRISGNLLQLGSTPTQLSFNMGNLPSKMPVLTQSDDGLYFYSVRLHAGNPIKYKYTLGDGYFNDELDATGSIRVRQFLIPNQRITIKDEIISWNTELASPIEIRVSAPEYTPQNDLLSIQFFDDQWSQPIPMLSDGNGQWRYPVFDSGDGIGEIYYHICRNDLCELTYDETSYAIPYIVNFDKPDTNQITISDWNMWNSEGLQEYSEIPKSSEISLGVEFVSDFKPIFFESYKRNIPELKSLGIGWIIFSPVWRASVINGLPNINLDIDTVILNHELIELIKIAQSNDISVSLFPRLQFPESIDKWWETADRTSLWWQQWYLEYERFITNYIILAAEQEVEQFILGGQDTWASVPGTLKTTEVKSGTPKNSEDIWNNLTIKLNNYFQGELVWAVPLNYGELGQHEFYDQMDAFYLLLDTEGELDYYATHDTVNTYIDSVIPRLDKPIYFGLNSPSYLVESKTEIFPDYLISPLDQNYSQGNLDMDRQKYFYQVYTEALKSGGWASGIATRGFFPATKLMDFSSSTYGKPAFQEFLDAE